MLHVPAAEEFTPQAELLGQMEELSQRDAFADNIRYGACVTAVRTVDAQGEETQDDAAAAGDDVGALLAAAVAGVKAAGPVVD